MNWKLKTEKISDLCQKTEIRVETEDCVLGKKKNYENQITLKRPNAWPPSKTLNPIRLSALVGYQRRDFRSFLTQGFFHAQEISVATIALCIFCFRDFCKGHWFAERGRMAVVAAVPLCASQLAATRKRSLSSEPSASYSSAHCLPAVARVNCWRNSFLASSGLLLLFLLQKKLEP
jgi:hypothetical protein